MNKPVQRLHPDAEVDAPVEAAPDPLALLRRPFAPHHISKLPKPTKAQTDAVKADFKKGIRCKECGAWHHPEVVHLDYVGHAALTDRLLDVDPHWSWEPVAYGADGLPAFDRVGGLWIKLTVCGVTRPGYGTAPGKDGGDAVKEIIGDALRNAAMRFGAALDLWHKGDLHPDADDSDEAPVAPRADTRQEAARSPTTGRPETISGKTLGEEMERCLSVDELLKWEQGRLKDIKALPPAEHSKLGARFTELTNSLPQHTPSAERRQETFELDDEIPF